MQHTVNWQLSAFARVIRLFRGSALGATQVEYMVVAGFCALFGIASFRHFGSVLKKDLKAQAEHIEGKGLPNSADLLGSLASSYDQGCRGSFCVIPGACFAAGTPVEAEFGARAIEQLRVGDRVWSKDVESGEVALRRVSQTFAKSEASVIELELSSDLSPLEHLTVTPNHRFWVEGQGWTRADQLSAQPLWSAHSAVAGTALATQQRSVTVYNLEVEQFHSYFVGRSRVLVHNDCPEGGLPGTGSNPAAAAGQTPGAGSGPASGSLPLPLPGSPEDLVEQCKERLDNSSVKYKPKTSTGLDKRPAQAQVIDQICAEMAEECQGAKGDDLEECMKKTECIYKWIASHPTTGYLTSTTVRTSVQRYCANQQLDATACFGDQSTVPDWDEEAAKARERPVVAGPSSPISAADQNLLDACAKYAAEASKPQPDSQTLRELSEAAAQSASLAYANSLPPSYTCVDGGRRSRVFDLVCFQLSEDGTISDLIVLESKGGSSQLKGRWGVNGNAGKRVQQGTPEYMEATIYDLRRSNHTFTTTENGQPSHDFSSAELGDILEDAVANDDAEYVLVNQKFKGGACVTPYEARKFELNPLRRAEQCAGGDCKCL